MHRITHPKQRHRLLEYCLRELTEGSRQDMSDNNLKQNKRQIDLLHHLAMILTGTSNIVCDAKQFRSHILERLRKTKFGDILQPKH